MLKRCKLFLELVIILVLIFLIAWLYRADFSRGKSPAYGVTFSQKYAEELHLDWQKVYAALLTDLQVKKIRLVAYWDLIEREKGEYDFKDLDWAINQAGINDAKVILVIGHRVPRWPECHWPNWSFKLSQAERYQAINQLLTAIVSHYKDNPVVVAWQVENEPYLKIFGECPRPDREYFNSEVRLVGSLDSRPLVITESGELSTWLRAAHLADQVGVSVYRITWNKSLGYFYYPLPPAYYYLKARLVRLIAPIEDIFISEMQMEPWLAMKVLNTPLMEQYHSMDLEKFRKNFSYARRTGLSPIYFWGAEWWYWLKEQGDDSIWQAAKKIWLND